MADKYLIEKAARMVTEYLFCVDPAIRFCFSCFSRFVGIRYTLIC